MGQALLLVAVAAVLDAPRRLLSSLSEDTTDGGRFEGGLFALLGLAVIPVLYGLDLPGLHEAAVLGGATIALVGAATTMRGSKARSKARSVALQNI